MFKKFGDDMAGNLAVLVAYYAFLSIFPLLLVLVTILAFLIQDDPQLQDQALRTVIAEIPVVGSQIGDQVDPLQGSGVALLIGVAAALWGGLGVMQAGQNAMNTVWNVPRQRRPNFFLARLRSLGLLVLLGTMIVLSTGLASLGLVVEGLGPLGVLATVAVNVGLFLMAFQVLTAIRIPWPDLVPGAVVAALANAALQSLGGLYVNRAITNASDVYGVFATVIGLLSFLYLASQALLLAAEVNVVRARRLWPRSLVPDDLTVADHETLEVITKQQKLHPDQHIDVTFDDTGVSGGT